MTYLMKVTGSFYNIAQRNGQHLVSLPLNDGAVAKVLWNEKGYDYFEIEKGYVRAMHGMRTDKTEKFLEDSESLIIKLQKIVNPKIDVIKQFANSMSAVTGRTGEHVK